MSRIVAINYEQAAIECQSVCELAREQLSLVDSLLSSAEDGAASFSDAESRAIADKIRALRSEFSMEIKSLTDLASERAKLGTVRMSVHDSRVEEAEGLKKAAAKLLSRVNEISSGELARLRALFDKRLFEKIRERGTSLDGIGGSTRAKLEAVSDVTLREFVKVALIDNPTLSFEEALALGERNMNETLEERREAEAELIREELRLMGIAEKEAKEITSPEKTLPEMRAAASEQIVGEKIRKKSLKIIMKAISDRGFIVDKKNVKIDRERNEVTMVALKASGERASFRVYLDGRFIYDFGGYEGQACQKDIEPFMRSLEEVYGMRVTSSVLISSNPDKNSTMKYQSMNINKNKR